MKFKCATCEEEHDLEKLSFGAEAPLQWHLLKDEERAESMLTSDQCEIETQEGSSYYIRACLEIPVLGRDRAFTWGVWCSLSEASHEEVCRLWDDPRRVEFGPYFGWLSTVLPFYPDTALLKTHVHQRPNGQRPWVELEPTDHPLAVDQREGIEETRLMEMVTKLLHDHA